ncbi:hypothetical protein EDB85DRAFT_1865891 [Lactarius pseudohatsudake]|nr:hypothetical protein EDB85DRAFT_1865891 [Lactarius pseudohatsudake]
MPVAYKYPGQWVTSYPLSRIFVQGSERTAALYSLLQHPTPVQIRFFLQMVRADDPVTALLSCRDFHGEP